MPIGSPAIAVIVKDMGGDESCCSSVGDSAAQAGADATDVGAKGEKRHADEEGKRKRRAAGELGLDMYGMREPLKKAGLTYVDELPED